jgi:hypothetical protein
MPDPFKSHCHGQAAPAAEPPRRRPHAQPPTETPRRTAPASNLYTPTPPRRRRPPAPRRKPADQPQAQPRPRRRELLETTAVLRISTSQMKVSARPLEGRGHAEPQTPVVLRLLDHQHYKPNPCGKPSRYPTQKDAATNTASIAQKPVGAWSRLSPTPIEMASWKGVMELRHAPAPTRRGPHKAGEVENLPDATTATTSPRYSSHPPAKTPWRQRKKESRNPLRRAAVRGRARRAPLSSAEGSGHP